VTAGVNRAGRRVAAAIMVAAMGMTALVFAAPAASAASTAKFCDAVNNISDSIQSGPNTSDSSGLKSTAAAIKKAAKSAPGSIKSAMNTMAGFYSSLAGASKAEVAAKLATGVTNYSKAAAKFTKYYVKNCSVLPTTTTKK
jgi:hypothetical protein